MQGAEKELLEALMRGTLEGAPLEDADRALLEFVGKVTLHAYKTTPEDIAALHAVGWSDDQIAEAIYVTGVFAMVNRVADAFGLPAAGRMDAVLAEP